MAMSSSIRNLLLYLLYTSFHVVAGNSHKLSLSLLVASELFSFKLLKNAMDAQLSECAFMNKSASSAKESIEYSGKREYHVNAPFVSCSPKSFDQNWLNFLFGKIITFYACCEYSYVISWVSCSIIFWDVRHFELLRNGQWGRARLPRLW
nr:uncharacterized protein LOC117274399 [Nicotiana tomentosiformis]